MFAENIGNPPETGNPKMSRMGTRKCHRIGG
jgi:hypothetical protein